MHRKVVTVLFCDVVGSTALGESVDPEALQGLLARYFERMKAIIESHEGSVEKFIGDAVMAVFGVPQVHEDDALRACRAAVEMRAAFPELGVQARIGVNTGEVVTGSEERLAAGDAVNIAARLQNAAEPDEILIGSSTLELVRGAVETEPVEPLELKGKTEPVPAQRLLSVPDMPERSHESRFVGREREVEMILEAWKRAETGRCELVTVVGDPGIGKSRLVAEALAALDVRVVRGRCLPYGEGITYWPVVEVIKQLDALPSDPAAAAAVSSLLGESAEGTSADQIAWAFRKLLEEQTPLVAVFDDIQWGEETFLDLVEATALLAAAPLLIVCMARPELLERRSAWPGVLRLDRLSDDEADELIRNEVSEDLGDRIAHAAGGNPLFISEMLAMAHGQDHVQVPPTLKALLAARLDQLDEPERRVLERGSVEGELFHRGAVQALAPEEPQVTARLTSLVRRELVRPDRAQLAGDDGFRFRHLLIRDAAYDALPKSLRADLHERFADWLVSHTELIELDEIAGYHLEQAHRCLADLGPSGARGDALGERASKHLASSGRRAYARGDLRAAAGLLERAASLLPSDDSRRIELLPDLGRALFETGEPHRAEEMLAQAVDWARATGQDAVAVDAAVALATVRLHIAPQKLVGQREVWRELSDAIPFYERSGDEAGLARALGVSGNLRFWRGENAAAIEDHLRAARHARNAGDWTQEAESLQGVTLALLYGPTPVDDALKLIDEIAPIGERNRPLKVHVLRVRAQLEAMRGQFALARDQVKQAFALAEELGQELTLARVAMNAGPIELLAGDPIAAERCLRPAYESMERMQVWGYLSSTVPLLVDALLEQGRVDEALSLTEPRRDILVPEDIDAQVGWRRVRARAQACHCEADEAEGLAREAAELADRTEYLNLRAHAHADLAEVLRAAGKPEEASAALTEAIRLYEEKGNTAAIRALTAHQSNAGRPDASSPSSTH